MKNYKIEYNIGGDENWPDIARVLVKGIAGQNSASEIEDNSEREEVIQSWKNVAVMKATSDKPMNFYIGFLKDKKCQYLKHEFTTNLYFGMRVGPEDVNFFVLPTNFQDRISLELVEITTEDDPKYSELVLI